MLRSSKPKGIRAASFALFLAAALAGCAAPNRPTGPPGTSSTGPIFLVHGIWPDGEDWWANGMGRVMKTRGLEPIVVTYNCFVGGYLFGYGTSPAAEHIARFVRDAEEQHALTSCRTPFRWNAVGYSAGTMVLTKAADLGVQFERVYFAGSPITTWSGYLADQLNRGKIQRLINYYSPFDLLVWVTCGSGFMGYHGPTAQPVLNRAHFRTHYNTVWNQDQAQRDVIVELMGSAEGAPHTCFQVPGFRRWFDDAKKTLLN